MDYTRAFAISAVGMNIERARVDVAALNLANANTVQGAGGTNYQPMRVVAQAGLASPSAGEASDRFGAMIDDGMPSAASALPTVSVVPTHAAARLVYEPGHPMADQRGYVSFAGVDTATEMVSLMSATRAYEANVAAMNTARTLALRALDIGGPNA